MSISMRHRRYTTSAWVLRALLVAALVQQMVVGDWVGVLALALFVALSFGYLLRDDRLPNAFDGMATLAALLNALGFVFDLYQRIPLYDEFAHAITIFAFTLAFFYLVYRDEAPRRRWVIAVAVFSFGVTLGSIWEVAEWCIGRILDTEVVYGLDDAITDLMANSAGALAAALAALRLPPGRDRGRRPAGRAQAEPPGRR